MKHTKLWSVLLAAVLICACAVGTLLLGADAADARILNVTGTSGAETFATVEAALAEAESLAEAGELTDAGVKIVVSANQEASVDANGILFGQKTIWLDKSQGKKLPITIEGSTTSVSLTMPAGNIACANDYTFVGMEVGIGKQKGTTTDQTLFYAGSGNVVFERVNFGGKYGKFFADNFTRAAYEGWPLDYSAMVNEKGLLESSMTFGENSEFSYDATNYIGAVGWTGSNNPLSSITAKITDAQIETAKTGAAAFEFQAATGVGEVPDIKPVNTRAVMIIDTKPTATEISDKSRCVYYPTVRAGLSPVAEAELKVYSGVIDRLRADQSSGSSFETFVGDSYLSVYGGTFTCGDHCVRGLNACNLVGSFYVYVTELDKNVKTQAVGETGGLQVTANGPRVTENCTLTIEGGSLKDIYGGTADKKVINVVKGGTVKKFFGSRCNASGTTEVENYVVGGTFTGNYFGAYVGQAWPADLKSITNKISGGTFQGGIYPSSDSPSYTTLDYISNEYLANQPDLGDTDGVGPVVNGVVFGTYLKDCGKIYNLVEAGTFNGKNADGITVFLASHDNHTGGIENVINGGTFKAYVFAGGQSASTKISNTKGSLGADGKLLPAVKTTINGGTFHGFWGAYGSVSGEVLTTVNGGDFYPYQNNYENPDFANSFAGGTRSTSSTTMPNITNVINGGVFHSNFYAGSGLHIKATTQKVYDNATVTTYLYGGTFKLGIFANSKHPDVGPLAGTAEMIVDPSKSEKPLSILGKLAVTDGDTSTVTLVGGEEAILIGKNTNIVADGVTGKVLLNQTEGWLAHDYLAIPATAQYEITESPEIFGSYVADDTILVKGAAIEAVGATLRLGERLGVRIVLNQADVEEYGEEFTYTVKLGDTKIASGTYADIVANGYSILFDGIGLGDFGTEFTVSTSVSEDMTYSIVALAELAQTAWANDAKWKAYADAVIEFHNVYNLDKENTVTPAAVTTVPAAAKGELSDQILSASAAVLMSDAAGLRLSVELSAAPANVKFVVGDKEFAATVTENTVSADLFVAHQSLDEAFTVSVQNEDGQVYMTYTTSIEALTNVLASQDAAVNSNRDNAIAFLCYIQAAVACK